MKRKLHIQARQERTGIYKTRLKAPKPGEHVPVPQEPAAPLVALPPLPQRPVTAPAPVAAVRPRRRPLAVAVVSAAALLIAVFVPARVGLQKERGWMSPRRVVAAAPVPPPPPDAKVWAAAPPPRSVVVAVTPAPVLPPVASYSGDMPLFDDGRVYVGP